MRHALVQDVAASWEHYEQVTAVLFDPVPDGLVLHVAGPTDEGFRTVDIWETKEAWEHFCAETVAPAVAAVAGPARPKPTCRDFRVARIVTWGALR